MQRIFIQIHDLRPFQHHLIPINETTILQEAVTLAHSIKKLIEYFPTIRASRCFVPLFKRSRLHFLLL
jgi:hypothetical protein